jgi:3-dehydroquinate dehydratase
MDYDALAKQYGGADAAPVIDYDALAKQYGGADMPAPTGMPGQRKAPSGLKQFGRSAASLADVTIGNIIPGAVQYLAYPFARVGRSPEEAQAITQGLVSAVDKPFGKAFGVSDTPEYQQEAGRQVMDFIGQNFQKGAKWISENTGLPQADVESYMASATLTAPKVVPPVVKAVKQATAPIVEKAKIGMQMPFEPARQAKRERQSAESYAKAPQLDAAAEAQRLKIALNPADIDPSVSTRFLSAAAGPRGPESLATANKPRVTEIAKNELGLDNTTSLTSGSYKQARANLAAPYDEVRKLPAMVADEGVVKNLNELRRNNKLIGGEGVAKKVNKLVDNAVDQTQAGLTGAELLDNVRNLRSDAKKIYNNQNATPKQIAVADANLAIANQLESMIESNISNPKLLDQFRDARQKMARTYVYEGATDFNTGMVDVSKLARITAKDNALTGDIASLGKIAGNFPDVFTTTAASKFYDLPRLSRSGLAGGGGALIGSQFGLTGSIVGGLLGGGLGELGGAMAAKRMASPGYQAGLKLQDFRIPTNQLAAASAPIPQNQAVVPFDPRNALVQPTDIVGYAQDGTPITAAQAFSRPNFTMPRQGPEFTPPAPPAYPQLAAPSPEGTFGTLRAEDARRAGVSRALGQQAEAQQAAAEAAARKPATREVMLDFDPVTGRMREASQGVKGATPETFRSLSSLDEAAKKVTAGKLFDLTAAEKVAWEKATVDIKDLGAGYTKLSDKAIAQKMMDRQWVAEAYTKAREKAAMFDEIAQRAANQQTKFDAAVKRDQMLDLLTTLEDNLRAPRPTSAGGQGPKTREAIRNKLLGGDNQNNLR